MAVEVGQAAPDFTLYDTDRNQRSLSEFRGKNVVLAFFPGAFTGACTNEMCTFRDQLGQYEGMNAQVIGITVDPPFAQKAWCDANNVTYPFLSDYAREVTNLYDLAFPTWPASRDTWPATAPSSSSTARAWSATPGPLPAHPPSLTTTRSATPSPRSDRVRRIGSGPSAAATSTCQRRGRFPNRPRFNLDFPRQPAG